MRLGGGRIAEKANSVDSQEYGNQPSEQPQEQAVSQSPAKPAISLTEVSSDSKGKPEGDQSTAREMRREFRWFEVISLIVNACLAIIAVIALCIYYGQLKVMHGQLGQMKSGSAQTDNLIIETHNLAVAAKEQADASKALADAAKQQAGSTARLAQASTDQVVRLETLAAATQEAAQATLSQSTTSAKALEANQRPWLILDISIASPIVFGPKGARFDLKVAYRNVGGSTATFVNISHRFYMVGTILEPIKELEKMCDEMSKGGGLNNAVFVNTEGAEVWPFYIPKEDFDGLIKKFPGFAPAVIGCVAYRSVVSDAAKPRPFYTGRVLEIARTHPVITNTGMSYGLDPPGPIPVEDIFLRPVFWEGPYVK